MSLSYRRVLTIAGSDSGAGAGIQADLKTIAACGCYGTSAITAVTAQNTLGVHDIHPVPLTTIQQQIHAILGDIGTDAVKIGMLANKHIITTVAECLSDYSVKDIVLDPVMVATSGDKLLADGAIEVLKKELIPMARIITPNIPEAEVLLERKIQSQNEFLECAHQLADLLGVSVYLKAGHLEGEELVDVFYDAEAKEHQEMFSKRLKTKNTHGTGCTLSAAMAAFLAQGKPLGTAAQNAHEYVFNAILAGANYSIGQGHGPVHHFHSFWEG